MMLAEKLGMTLAELEDRMTAAEFDLWIVEYGLRAQECPGCGLEVRDMNEYVANEVKCPICKTTYNKILPRDHAPTRN